MDFTEFMPYFVGAIYVLLFALGFNSGNTR